MKVDDDTQKALLLFNRRAEAAEAAKTAERRLAKAVKAKDEAAEALWSSTLATFGMEAFEA